MARRKAQLGLSVTDGGALIPIGKNMFLAQGRTHAQGGIGLTFGKNYNPKGDLEIEKDELVQIVGGNNIKFNGNSKFKGGGQSASLRVFSSVPLLRGVSPAELVLQGYNPDDVFKAQEEFKDRNRINDDGTSYQTGGKKKSNSAIRTEDDKKVPAYNRAVYSLVDPTMGYPTKKEAVGYAIGAGIKAMRNPNDMVYWVEDSVSDAGWRKRLGLSYDDKFLIPNEDGSVRLPKDREMEIPVDTTMLKNRIAANKKLAKRYPEGTEKRDIVDWALRVDGMALDSLRHTYRTGKPVVINEGAYNNRQLINNGELSYPEIMPHNVLQNYTIQYNPKTKQMEYRDAYDFNEYDWGVPGKTYEIKGSIPVKKAGGIYIKPSKRGTFTAAAKKRGMGVQKFASKVLANKEDYSLSMVKKANFARNASRWKKEYGGNMIYTINGNVKNGLMSARPKAELGIEKNIKYPYRDNNGQYYINNGYKIYSNGQILNEKGYSKYYVNVDKNKNVVGFSLDENGNREIAPLFNESTARKAYNYSKNKRPQYYAEKRLPIAGSQSIAEKAGLARSGWSYADNETISLNYIPNINLSIPDNYGKSSTPRKGETKSTSSKASAKSTPTLQDNVNQITRDAIYRSNTPKIDLSKVKMPTFDVSQLGNKESKTYKANTPKSGRWIGQYKTTNIGDWIGLGSNLAGSIASYFMTKNAINKMPDPIKPIMAQAAKLKTRYNVEPQLTNIREAEQMNRATVRRNTQSSNTSLAREQRLMNEARGARNQLYGQKENIETQLINQDRLNRQTVNAQNVATYNDYLTRLYAGRVSQNEARVSNINNLLSGLTGSVNNILGTIESRRATNNTLRAIAAANPNVDARLIGGFDYYIDPITKRKYNKNQQYVGTING